MPYLLEDDWEEKGDFILYGIKSRKTKDYEFIYNVNRALQVNFKRIKDLDVKINNDLYCFSLFFFEDPEEEFESYIIKNEAQPLKQTDNTSLFGEFFVTTKLLESKQSWDYLLKVNVDVIENSSFVLSFQSMNEIENIQRIENLKQKDRNKFIF